MSSNQKNIQGGSSSDALKLSNALKNREVVLKTVGGKQVLAAAHQAGVYHKIDTHMGFSIQGTVPANCLQTPTVIDFQIIPQDILVKDLALEWTVLGESTNTAVLTPAPMFADIEFWVNGGSKLLQTIQAERAWLDTGMVCSSEQIASLATVGNYTSTFGNGSAIATNSTQKFYVPLAANFIAQRGGFDLSKIKGYIIVRVKTRASIVSGTGLPTVSSLRIIAETDALPTKEMETLNKVYANAIIEGRFLDGISQRFPSQTYTAGQSYTMPIQAVNGFDVPYLIACFRASVSTAAGSLTFAAVGPQSVVTVLDNSGVDLISGSSNLAYNWFRYVETAKALPGTLFANLNLIPIFFGNPVSALKGIQDGGAHLTTYEKLYLSLDSTFSSGSYVLDLYLPCFRTWRLVNGFFELI